MAPVKPMTTDDLQMPVKPVEGPPLPQTPKPTLPPKKQG